MHDFLPVLLFGMHYVFGIHDFLLLTKDKNDKTNWFNIPPRILDDLPDFNVGRISEEDKIIEEEQSQERKRIMNERNNDLIKAEEKMNRKRIEEEKELLNRVANIDMSEIQYENNSRLDDDICMDESDMKRKNEEEMKEEKKKTKSM